MAVPFVTTAAVILLIGAAVCFHKRSKISHTYLKSSEILCFGKRFLCYNHVIVRSGAYGLTDIHCHILPVIDDGAANGKMTVSMLRKAYAEGVRRIIVTPHYRGMFEPPMDKVYKRYWVRKRPAGIGAFGIEVYLGCEYHRHSDMAEVLESGRRPTMAGSRYVLWNSLR